MTRASRVDARPQLAAVAAVTTMAGQPDALFGAASASTPRIPSRIPWAAASR